MATIETRLMSDTILALLDMDGKDSFNMGFYSMTYLIYASVLNQSLFDEGLPIRGGIT